ncbi:hypothetical protein Ciccas_010307, partial [Cichlidogyrus casuarinus]
LVHCLAKYAGDPEQIVRNSIRESLANIGSKEPLMVIAHILGLLKKYDNPSSLKINHRVVLLESVAEILHDSPNCLEKYIDFAQQMCDCALKEMTHSSDIVENWQNAAASVLLELSTSMPKMVVNKIMSCTESGVVPHLFIVKTLGLISQNNCKDNFIES